MSSRSLFFTLCTIGFAYTTATSVKTKLGAVDGTQCPESNVTSYLGIPYAQPPTGDLRFASPVPYTSSYSGGHLNATAYGPTCIQFANTMENLVPASEDW